MQPADSAKLPIEAKFPIIPNHRVPEKTLKAIGIGLVINGIILITFGALAYLVDASMSSLCSGVWTGLLVFVTGLLSFGSTNSTGFVYLCTSLIIAILSVTSVGFLTVLAANTVAKEIEFNDESLTVGLIQRPTLAVNFLLLATSIM